MSDRLTPLSGEEWYVWEYMHETGWCQAVTTAMTNTRLN